MPNGHKNNKNEMSKDQNSESEDKERKHVNSKLPYSLSRPPRARASTCTNLFPSLSSSSSRARGREHVFLPCRRRRRRHHRGRGLRGATAAEEDIAREQLRVDGSGIFAASGATEASADVVGGASADGIHEEAGREGAGRNRREGCAGGIGRAIWDES